MSTSVESTAVMSSSSEPEAVAAESAAAVSPEAVGAVGVAAVAAAGPGSAPPADGASKHRLPRPERSRRISVSPNVIISLLGGLLTALLMWQFNTLGNSIDSLGARIDNQGAELRAEIDSQGAELRAEIGALRTEMQAGFREVNATLLDHTDRLARLETAAGLSRIDDRVPAAP